MTPFRSYVTDPANGVLTMPARFITRSAPLRLALLALIPLALGPFALASAAQAQSNPSADQIIRALRPTGGLGNATRGIKPLSPAATPGAPAAAPAAPAPAPQAVAAKAAPSVNLTVQFATGSAVLTPAAMQTLDALGQALSSSTLSAYKFRIEGHTDTVGTPDMNKSLSDQRAAAVASYLTTKFGVTPDRLQPVGLGEDGLLVPTASQVAEPRNRRVQVVNLGA